MHTNNVLIADFVDNVSVAVLPEEVVDMARRSLLDWVAVSVSAMAETEAEAVSGYVAKWGSTGDAVTLFGRDGAAAPVALVNGMLAHLLDFDDIHYGAALHAGAPTWAATLALGMSRKLGADRLLRGFVAGYEVAAAFGVDGTGVGLATRGWHPTAILGHLSSAVAGAVLLGLDRSKLASALGTAATQAGGMIAAGGTAAKPFQIGKAAMAGVMAAEMAELNVDGPHGLLDADQLGMFKAMIGRDVAAGALGVRWHILDNSFKPYASCGFTHSAIEAAQRLARVVVVPDIRRVRIFGNPVALQVAGHLHPREGIEARFSLSYAVALGLLGCDPTPAAFGGEHLPRQDMLAMLDRTELVADPALERWSSRIELTLQDGQTRSETVLVPVGMGQRTLDWHDIEAKFMAVAPQRFGADAEALLKAIRTFGDGGATEDVRTMFRLPEARRRKLADALA